MKNRVADFIPAPARPAGRAEGDSGAGFQPQQWVAPVEKLVRDHPGAALAAAFAIGVTIAWFVKRK